MNGRICLAHTNLWIRSKMKNNLNPIDRIISMGRVSAEEVKALRKLTWIYTPQLLKKAEEKD